MQWTNTQDDNFPKCNVFAVAENGIIKAVNAEKRSVVNYFDGAQPTEEDALHEICEATHDSFFAITRRGELKYFNKGKFTTAFRFRVQNPTFIGMMPRWRSYQSTFQNLDEPNIDKTMLVTVFSSGICFYRGKRIFHAFGQQNKEMEANSACIHDRSITLCGKSALPQNFDLHSGRSRWQSFDHIELKWRKEYQGFKDDDRLNDYRALLVDGGNPGNQFFTSTSGGSLRFDVSRVGGFTSRA